MRMLKIRAGGLEEVQGLSVIACANYLAQCLACKKVFNKSWGHGVLVRESTLEERQGQ